MKHVKWAGVCVTLLMFAAGANAQDTVSGNIFFDNASGAEDDASGNYAVAGCPQNHVGNAGDLFHNDVANPMLADPLNNPIDGTPGFAPDMTPAAGSIASGMVDAVSKFWFIDDDCENCEGEIDLCAKMRDKFVPVCYRGAIEPGGEDWTAGWTYYSFDGLDEDGNPRTDIDFGKPLEIHEGVLGPGELNWSAASNHLLRGRVSVAAGDELVIEAGTVIFGEAATAGYLVIERDAKIHADGEWVNPGTGVREIRPIIFTSDALPGDYARGGWGGVVIHGNAIANCADCIGGESCASEGGTAGFFCGSDDCDDSGLVRYARVEYAGIGITIDNELNAWTFNGLGCATALEYLQAHMGFDDNFEWFGGKPYGNHWLSTGGGDDGFDWQMGFRGGLQFAIDQHWADDGDKGIEADNNEFDNDAPCRSKPILANLTLIGPGPAGGSPTDGINLRRGTDASVHNSIIAYWNAYGIQVQNAASLARGLGCDGNCADPGVFCSPTVAAGDVQAPTASVALRAFPNPVKTHATFAITLDADAHVELGVYDVSGRLVDSIADQQLTAGAHEITWAVPSGLSTGVYYYRMIGGAEQVSGRLFHMQ